LAAPSNELLRRVILGSIAAAGAGAASCIGVDAKPTWSELLRRVILGSVATGLLISATQLRRRLVRTGGVITGGGSTVLRRGRGVLDGFGWGVLLADFSPNCRLFWACTFSAAASPLPLLPFGCEAGTAGKGV